MLEERLPTEELEIRILDPAVTQRLIAQVVHVRSAKPAISRVGNGGQPGPSEYISRARNHSLQFEGIAKTICKKTAAPPPNSGKNHYLERLNHPSRSMPWKYFTGDYLLVLPLARLSAPTALI